MPDEYIKRSDAILAIQKYGVGSFDFEEDGWTPEQAERFVIAQLNKIRAEDVVPVVRCKDCYHSMPHTNTDYIDCPVFCIALPNDFYCKYGRKKDD